MSGFKQGVIDFIEVGIGDVSSKYQEFLMQDASISPPTGLPVDYVQTTTEIEIRAPEPARLEAYGPPTNDAIPGLDIG